MVRKGPLPGAQVGPIANLGQVSGTALTGRDWSIDFRNIAQALNPSTVFTRTTLTVTALTDIVNRSGRGILRQVRIEDLDASANVDRIAITIDGVLFFDVTGDATAGSSLLWKMACLLDQSFNVNGLTVANMQGEEASPFFYNVSLRVQGASHTGLVLGTRYTVVETRFL